ncbi:LysM domain-containing membrane protein [Lachnospiraceae bacterium KM106-2]|nr:LysM domain-containing membrane protein [Lachnospiraceae bacterium KM106-2]
MELIKKNIHMNKLKCKSSMQLTLDDDFNVPDVKPDIDRIVKEQGDITLNDVKAMNGKLMIKGELNFNLLYVSSDDERPVHNIVGKIPFEEYVNMDEACDDSNIVVKWEIEDLTTSLINSRKISVRSIVSFKFMAEDIFDAETAVGIEGDQECQYLNEKMDITEIVVNTKDTYRIKDEVMIPSGKPNIFEVLYYDMDLRNVDTRILDNKISIKGEISIFVLYSSESEEQPIQFIETDLPFSGVIDCNGCNESMIADIDVLPISRTLEAKDDTDGEERVLDLEMVLELDVKAYEENQVDILKDVYSTAKSIIPVYEEASYENLVLKNNSKSRVVDHIEVDASVPRILQICNASGNIRIDETQIVYNGIQVEGVIDIQMLYITDDDKKPLGSIKGSVPFSLVVEVKNVDENCIYSIRPNIEQLSVMMLDSSDIEVKAGINLDTIVFNRIKQDIIKDLRIEPLDTEKLQTMPSMIGYIVQAGDTLWDIAKQFYTTVDSIKELNELPDSNIQQGDKLLLLKKVDAIL